MNTYLNRPVFEFDWEWAQTPEAQFQYNLREILLGQAAPKFQPTANHVLTGLTLQVLLEDAAALSAFDVFVDSVKGRLTGFWLASPVAACKIIEPIGAGLREFYIQDCLLRDSFTEQSYLAFHGPDGTRQFGRIAQCVLEAGRERVTLREDAATGGTSPTSAPLSAAWEAFRLRYVRLTSDDVEIDFVADNLGRVNLRVIELPEEYAAIETGQQPVFLYELAFAGLGVWRYTNLNQDFAINDPDTPHAVQNFTSWPIRHDGHTQALAGGENTLKLTTVFDQGSPVSKLFPYPAPKPLSVKVWEVSYGAPHDRTLLFTGFVNRAKLAGAQAELECVTWIAALGASFPRFLVQNRCNFSLFSGPCSGVDGPQKASYRVAALVDQIAARNVVLKNFPPAFPLGVILPGYPQDYFTFGYLEHVNRTTGLVDMIRTVESNYSQLDDGTLYLTMTAPVDAVEFLAGDTVYLYPGCDGTHATCASKFNNFSRWGGHNLAAANLAITAVDVPSQTANKK